MIKFMVFLTTLILFGCTGVTPISQRPIVGENGDLYKLSRKIGDDERTEPVYTKHDKVVITEVDEGSDNGSLYRMDDNRNQLFLETPLIEPGRFVTVAVVNNRGAKKDPSAAPAANGAQPEEKDELLSALPHLDTKDAQNKPLTMFKMKVDRILPNGDLELSFHRYSENGYETHDLKITAKAPAAATMPGKEITTADLYDVAWRESEPYETIDRQSYYWEDEYTLRLSGFDEAKSKIAAKLEEDKKQLGKVRDNLETKIKALNDEKKTVVAERDKLAADRAAMEEKDKELTAKVDELSKQVEEQKQTIAEAEEAANKAEEDKKSASK